MVKIIKSRPAITGEGHTSGSDWTCVWESSPPGLLLPYQKLVKPQQMQPKHLKEHGPTMEDKANVKRKKKGRGAIMEGRSYDTKRHLIGTSPSEKAASCLKAPVDKSMEFPLLQVGQSSATVTTTLWPLLVLMISTFFPQRGDAFPLLPYRC